MKAVILAAGTATRWKNFTGVPKQLVVLNGEPLLHRTIRLLRERGVTEIYVTVPSIGFFGDLDAEEIVGSSELEIHKFHNASDHVGALLLWGDTYFTEAAIDTMLKATEFTFFGRRNGSKVTGKKWGEIFGVLSNRDLFLAAAVLASHAHTMKRCGTWELLTFITDGTISKNMEITENLRYLTVIDDLTDDIDYPVDLLILKKAIEYEISLQAVS